MGYAAGMVKNGITRFGSEEQPHSFSAFLETPSVATAPSLRHSLMSTSLLQGPDTASTSFAQSLQLFTPSPTLAQDDDPVLDVVNGLASKFRQICGDQLSESSGSGASPHVSSHSQRLWELEKKTWDLVGDLYS